MIKLIATRSVIALWAMSICSLAAAELDLESAVRAAVADDPWLRGNAARQEATLADSVAASALPDPVISMGLANLPTDTFDFDQEPMTQFRVGVSQVLPRGDTRALRQERLQLRSDVFPHQRSDREAKIRHALTSTWLAAYQSQASIHLIENDRGLFQQLSGIAEARYTAALGETRQQDLVRAQLELTRLDDRLAQLNERALGQRALLSRWLLPDRAVSEWQTEGEVPALALSRAPQLQPPTSVAAGQGGDSSEVRDLLLAHPAVKALDTDIDASRKGVALAEESYKPQWRLDASYGYRDDDPLAGDRADFFSLGVAFDLPVFTEHRQDQQVRSAAALAAARETDRALLLRDLLARHESARARLETLDKRRALYDQRLLREMGEQTEAALAAYTSDNGDFAEVVRSRIAELNAKIDALDIDVQRLLVINDLNYILVAGRLQP
ncbi:TolC family protein [Halioglobus pacificus]|uniref:Copper transporter n=1 Tax=Parahalioglobus pacificus TaxID=930806 RepID=A0A918XIB1_9GAMM|nr:TolC family protein [Halioglobus pacificus]GHD31980.1 copper transporter [Halioglobus pacificus]